MENGGKNPKQKPSFTASLELSAKASTETLASLSSTDCGVLTTTLSLIKKKNITLSKYILNNTAVYLCIQKENSKIFVYSSHSKLLFFFMPFHFLVTYKPFICQPPPLLPQFLFIYQDVHSGTIN